MFETINQNIRTLNKNEFILYLTAISIFLNPYICAGVAITAAIYALVNEDIRRRILLIPKSKWILSAPSILIPIPMLYGNWTGLAAALLIYAILVFSLYVRSVMTARLFAKIVNLICAVSIVCALVALAQMLLNTDVRTTALFTNANYYAYATELVIIMACYRLLCSRSGRSRIFFIVVLSANTFAMLTTGCRSAYASVLCGLAILFVIEKSYKGLAFLVSFSLAFVLLATRFSDMIWRLNELNLSYSVRLQIWMSAVNAILRHPLFGEGALTYYFSSGKEFWHAHDLYLELLASFGIVGTGMLCVYFANILSCLAASVRSTHTGEKSTAAMLLALISATLVHGITDVTVMFTQTGILFALLLAGISLVQKDAAKHQFWPDTCLQPYVIYKEVYGRTTSDK